MSVAATAPSFDPINAPAAPPDATGAAFFKVQSHDRGRWIIGRDDLESHVPERELAEVVATAVVGLRSHRLLRVVPAALRVHALEAERNGRSADW